jgi:putative membrane protein
VPVDLTAREGSVAGSRDAVPSGASVVTDRTGARLVETRRPRRVFGVGDEPDPRFTLANERTLLAWLRTALALVVAGVAIVALAELISPAWLVDVTASLAFVGGGLTAALGYVQWQRVERALRCHEPLPAGIGAVVVLATIIGLALIGAVALVGVGT